MMSNVVLELTHLLVPFCSVCVGFAMIGLGALVVVAIGEEPRRRRVFPTVELRGVRTPKRSAGPVDEARVSA